MLELRPNCEWCDRDLPPGVRRPGFAAMSAPIVQSASRPFCMTFAQHAVEIFQQGRSGQVVSGVGAPVSGLSTIQGATGEHTRNGR